MVLFMDQIGLFEIIHIRSDSVSNKKKKTPKNKQLHKKSKYLKPIITCKKYWLRHKITQQELTIKTNQPTNQIINQLAIYDLQLMFSQILDALRYIQTWVNTAFQPYY